ncbi:TetR/AcrR family transcriptional regulator [Cupriavidus pauculus]|uniref:TetR/AcrR family transcriptional regulator n=1 Tax=Cupriavidus pauculus TaxID=82633 RepID=UPI001FD47B2F|nr:TetR/AcrR family transcriptional regulator [Cupriavidus pauculus]
MKSNMDVLNVRLRIISAAELLFLKNGLSSVTMAQVGRAANVSRRAWEQNFPSIERLFGDLISFRIYHLTARLSALLDSCETRWGNRLSPVHILVAIAAAGINHRGHRSQEADMSLRLLGSAYLSDDEFVRRHLLILTAHVRSRVEGLLAVADAGSCRGGRRIRLRILSNLFAALLVSGDLDIRSSLSEGSLDDSLLRQILSLASSIMDCDSIDDEEERNWIVDLSERLGQEIPMKSELRTSSSIKIASDDGGVLGDASGESTYLRKRDFDDWIKNY